LLRRALRLCGLRWLGWALTLRLPLPLWLTLRLARHKPARLVLRRCRYRKSQQRGKNKAYHGAIIPC
jgi:hypothetical protein